jgi:uncharacterized membrane protein YccC
MYDDVNNTASPLWVRVSRMTICMAIAAGLSWRGMSWEDVHGSVVMPFLMCQITACVVAFLGLFALDTSVDEGPA